MNDVVLEIEKTSCTTHGVTHHCSQVSQHGHVLRCRLKSLPLTSNVEESCCDFNFARIFSLVELSKGLRGESFSSVVDVVVVSVALYTGSGMLQRRQTSGCFTCL